MKKIKLILAVSFFGVILMTSCKKERTCSCTVDGVTQKITYIDATKRQAKTLCLSRTQDNGLGTSVNVSCKLE